MFDLQWTFSQSLFACRRRQTPPLHVWDRRRDLSGVTVSAISQHWKPFITEMTEENEVVVVKGLYADIVGVLARRLNFLVKVSKNYAKTWHFETWDCCGTYCMYCVSQ